MQVMTLNQNNIAYLEFNNIWYQPILFPQVQNTRVLTNFLEENLSALSAFSSKVRQQYGASAATVLIARIFSNIFIFPTINEK